MEFILLEQRNRIAYHGELTKPDSTALKLLVSMSRPLNEIKDFMKTKGYIIHLDETDYQVQRVKLNKLNIDDLMETLAKEVNDTLVELDTNEDMTEEDKLQELMKRLG